MGWKETAHLRLASATGYQMVRRGGRVPRLARRRRTRLRSPVFIFSSVRSGSTLLRVILNSHSQLYAPHELHLSGLSVQLKDKYVRDSMAALRLGEAELTTMLWDQVLAAALERSGKSVLVEKTPRHVFHWARIARTWPDARFVFLLRHPAAIIDSWCRARPAQGREETVTHVIRYATKVEEARRALTGHTMRYEDLVTDPASEMRRLCAYLGVPWEPEMLEYGERDHGPIKAGLGDWTQRIRSGKIQPPRPLPSADDLPPELQAIARAWGYA
jgi:sulfotransferase family protein